MTYLTHLACRRAGTFLIIDNCDDQLRDTAENHANGEEDAAATPFRDDSAVDEDGDDTEAGQNARILKG
jgi:hypothetical protein